MNKPRIVIAGDSAPQIKFLYSNLNRSQRYDIQVCICPPWSLGRPVSDLLYSFGNFSELLELGVDVSKVSDTFPVKLQEYIGADVYFIPLDLYENGWEIAINRLPKDRTYLISGMRQNHSDTKKKVDEIGIKRISTSKFCSKLETLIDDILKNAKSPTTPR
ncbi:hypothetical protein J4405_02835 [Candidatus Woesearchaeota archaeon]|nr:hypothetical protein [Candidatus Woesearchaeota archaeon]